MEDASKHTRCISLVVGSEFADLADVPVMAGCGAQKAGQNRIRSGNSCLEDLGSES